MQDEEIGPAEDDRPYCVASSQVGGDTLNTLRFGWDLVVPLEQDLDDDPLQDDEVWLKDVDGRPLRRLLSTDADVTADPDSGFLLYRFRHVPFGAYALWVAVGGEHREVLGGVVVRAKGVFVGETQLRSEHEKKRLERPEDEFDSDDDASALDHDHCSRAGEDDEDD